MIKRLTYREWSIAVSLSNGAELLRLHREARRSLATLTREVTLRIGRDRLLYGSSFIRMGEGCTPVRVNPYDVRVPK